MWRKVFGASGEVLSAARGCKQARRRSGRGSAMRVALVGGPSSPAQHLPASAGGAVWLSGIRASQRAVLLVAWNLGASGRLRLEESPPPPAGASVAP
mmetsp:Transcript_2338/g.7214  ORF Transcript_2338/g.7214 Transcript_2338/m.7214 type:complete len:97 (+) Transcript_2338:116-406(+)